MKSVKAINCPECGGRIVTDNENIAKCPYCDTVLNVVDENEHTVNINMSKETVDHTRLAELAYEERKEKRNNKQFWIVEGVLALIVVLGFGGMYISEQVTKSSQKHHVEVAAEQGLICAGKSSDYEDQNYKSVKQKFKDMGFTNVSTKATGSARPWKWGDVIEVSINGRTNYDYSDYFKADASVLITYY